MTIVLSGWTLMLILMVTGGYYGWKHGMRAFLTITLVSVLAYMMFVNGVEQFLAYFDNLYSNLPKIISILFGGNPDATLAWPRLGLTLGLPLPVRVVLFIIFVALAWIFNTKPNWYSKGPKDHLSRQLGAFSGALTTLVVISAITAFWREASVQGGSLPGPINNFMGILPDVSVIAPWLITVFLLIVLVSVMMNLPKLWKA
jgi:hypothetical protein